MGNRLTRQRLWARRESEGLCVYCGKEPHLPGVKHGKKCLEKKNRVNLRYTQAHPNRIAAYRKRVRLEVISKYGGRCVCCGEMNPLFLTIDHINNDGRLDRWLPGQTMSSHSFYLKLRREPLREDLQLLCFNCNLGRAMNGGVCPHVLPAGKRFEAPKERRRNRRINWPDDESLLKMVQAGSISQAARQLDVSFHAVRNRLEKRELYDQAVKT